MWLLNPVSPAAAVVARVAYQGVSGAGTAMRQAANRMWRGRSATVTAAKLSPLRGGRNTGQNRLLANGGGQKDSDSRKSDAISVASIKSPDTSSHGDVIDEFDENCTTRPIESKIIELNIMVNNMTNYKYKLPARASVLALSRSCSDLKDALALYNQKVKGINKADAEYYKNRERVENYKAMRPRLELKIGELWDEINAVAKEIASFPRD